MPRRNSWRVCSTPECPVFTQGGGKCDSCQAEAEQRRGSASSRGYGHQHRTRFRAAVLARDVTCVLCHHAPAAHADHHPLSRRELVAAGLDPNDPAHGRGLCQRCHSSETARHQPGGWNA